MQLTVYRRDNRKKDERRWRRRFFQIGVVLGAAILAAAIYRLSSPFSIAAASLYDFVLDNAYFSVREIQVHGGDKVSGSEIVAIAGLHRGISIWKVDLAAIEKKIAKHPWVRRVLARREFPRRIVIDVEERVPKAIVAIRRLYYVDGDGLVFKEIGPGENVKFPLLTGLGAEELTNTDPLWRRRIQDAIRLAELMARRTHSLSEIHFEAPDRLVVYTTDFPVALRMGWGDWENKLERMERLMMLWKGNEERLASMDVSFQDQIVTRLRRVQR
ncbi:MAG TPA: FtsQ-type POTRA domain-containing protein [Candidatus Binatia bacterium]|jgi:cell division protein FtsQ|nr:FtsQ-type POTRA domain-containing protein [Candidatus Binatia bacterium]